MHTLHKKIDYPFKMLVIVLVIFVLGITLVQINQPKITQNDAAGTRNEVDLFFEPKTATVNTSTPITIKLAAENRASKNNSISGIEAKIQLPVQLTTAQSNIQCLAPFTGLTSIGASLISASGQNITIKCAISPGARPYIMTPGQRIYFAHFTSTPAIPTGQALLSFQSTRVTESGTAGSNKADDISTAGQSSTYTITSIPPTATPPINKLACAVDADCGCGVDINQTNTNVCVFQNKQYLSTKFTCQSPDFCSSITGACRPACINGTCQKFCPNITVTPSPTPTGILTTTPPPGCRNISNSWNNVSINAQTSTFTAEFDIKPLANNVDAVVGLSGGTVSSFTGLATSMRFNSSGTIDARNGASYQKETTITYIPNTTYHIKMLINPQTKKYSVTVKQQGGTEKTIATNFAFRTEQANLSTFTHWAAITGLANGASICGLIITPSSLTTTTPIPSSTSIPTGTVTPGAPCAKKKIGDADCKADKFGKYTSLVDFEIWRSEKFGLNGACSAANPAACCTSANTAGCGNDSDGDGNGMDANFNYVGSGNQPEEPNNQQPNSVVDLIDFNIWLFKGYNPENGL